MQFLVVTRRYHDRFTDAQFAEQLPAERRAVQDLYARGLIRQIWSREDVAGAAFLLEAASPDAAAQALAELPLARREMSEFTVVPLRAYAGFGPDDRTPVAPPPTVLTLVQRFYERLWNAWDDSAVESVLSPDFAFRGSLGDRTHGPDGWRRYRDKIRLGASNFHNEIVDVVTDGDHAAARMLYSGTHDGPLLGIAPTRRRFSYSGAAFFTADRGRLSAAWVLGDLENLRRQLTSEAQS